MANVRYYSEFRTLKGDFYLIEIYDSTFTGDESRVYTDSSGFTLTHDGETDQVFSPIIGSSVQFNVYNQDSAFDTFLNDILTQQDKRFFVKIYRSKHEATDDLNAFYNTTKVVKDGLVMFSTPYEEMTKYYDFFWCGYVVQDLIEEADESKPRLVSLKASDGISLLSTLDYNFALAQSFQKTIKDVLIDIFEKTSVDDLFSGDQYILTSVVNYYADEHTYSATTDQIDATKFDLKAFTAYEHNAERTYTNALDVIREICLALQCRFYFDNGSFRLEQLTERSNATIREFRYTKDGSLYQTESSLDLDVSVDQNNVYRSQGAFRYLPAIKKVTLTQEKKNAFSLIRGVVTFPEDEIDTGVISSSNNARVILNMRTRFQTFISTSLTGVATPVFAVTLRLEPTDGTANQYHQNTLISGVTTFSQPFWSTSVGTTKFAANAVSRQTSSTTMSVRSLSTAPIPKDGELFIDITILGFYDAQGSSTSFFSGGNSFNWAVDLNSAKYENDNDPSSYTQAIFSASNASTSLGSAITQDLGETRIGDGPATTATLYAYNGSAYVESTGWRVANSGSYIDIAKLTTKDVLSLQNSVVKRFEGTTIQGHDFSSRLDFDSAKWIQLRGTYTANTDEYQGEWFKIAQSYTDINEDTPVDVVDSATDTSIPDPSGMYANIASGAVAGMDIDEQNESIGPFEQTSTGGEINGSLNVTGASTLQETSVGEFTTTGRVNVTLNSITGNPGGSETLSSSSHFNFIGFESGENGTYTINLPSSEAGMILRFKTDDTISNSKDISLTPQSGDRIDGEASYTMDRPYDGITLMGGPSGDWFVIQKKEK